MKSPHEPQPGDLLALQQFLLWWASGPFPRLLKVKLVVEDQILGEAVIPVAISPSSGWPPAAPQSSRDTKIDHPDGEAFVPTDEQLSILDALENKALKTESLVSKSGVERRQLFRLLPKLKELGKVLNHPRLGYYRPDAPPAELIAAGSQDR